MGRDGITTDEKHLVLTLLYTQVGDNVVEGDFG
jgi:hypothetical protein